MSLTTALNIAQSALLATSRQTSVVSQNVAGARDPDHTRRIAVVSSTGPGARVVQIQRATNELLFRQNLVAGSSHAAQSALLNGMERLGIAVNGADNATAPAAALAELQKALDIYAANPSNRNLAEVAIDAARHVARTLNAGTGSIQSFRAETDADIATSVGELNDLLARFEDVNRAIISGTRAGRDVSQALDQRDGLLKNISELVPISTFTRGDNDMVIMAGNGSTLFETVPRKVAFEPLAGYSAGATGNAVYVDGVPLAGGSGGNTNASGKLAGLVQLRDSVASTMQSQLDEVARGMIAAFAETDPSAVMPDRPGLFTWPGAPGMPAAGALVDGLAGVIRLNAAFDSSVGGNPEFLRDGGANGAAYISNTSNAASYSDLLMKYGDRLDQPIAFDLAAQNGSSASVLTYASNSIGWFEGVRQDASRAMEAKEALAMRTQEALSNATGVNVDTEMTLLLDLENAYEASARILKAVDEMLVALLAAVR
ncbi:flagellar hook-associated protein FlgK [Arvimicrobium flavum]|uniref:flagellar hook-associated protein FlgK n=1 Tax=Arvimicrobium flavum TaxID=3393320 RepID=UPI00237BB951|nr:flagellar hook-associated protein FlgK [Mesorhizobium shangrilense]